MKIKIICILIMILLIGASTILTGTTLADWKDGDNHKMHFPQLPDLDGYDIDATHLLSGGDEMVELADDWVCSGSGKVRDIHFWGSWFKGDSSPINSFTITIYENVLADPLVPYSRPGEILWGPRDFEEWDEDGPIESGWQGYIDYCEDNTWVHNHETYYQYNIEDIPDPFEQNEGETYWLGITANIFPYTFEPHWGWKTADRDKYTDPAEPGKHYLDAAVYRCGAGDWKRMNDPDAYGKYFDLAFVITSDIHFVIRPIPRWPPWWPPNLPDIHIYYINWEITEMFGEGLEDLNWHIDISGVIMGKSFEGVVPFIDAGETVSIKTGPIIGFGPIEITAALDGCDPVKFDGQIYFIFIIME